MHQGFNRLLGEEARLQVIVGVAQQIAKCGGLTPCLGK